MPSIIRVLDDHTINKIAAGEVIENPASVVKELVENAIDAGASEICVEIIGGGRQLIRISDNGSGMSRDDALLSLERHATSKISQVEDIHTIETMGFRGEAVPSIAAVSKLTLITSQEEEEGTLLSVDGGKITQCGGAVRSRGTTFEVKSLFFNVPVRKKFQRSPSYDTNEIFKRLTTQSLAYPSIKFQLISNQKELLSTQEPKEIAFLPQLKERIDQTLGREYSVGLQPIEASEGNLKIEGYIGLPTFHRHNRTGQYLFINHRAVTSPLVSFAVKEGYGTALPQNRYPVYVLHLTMDGTLVDVNVHPQKREVRLRNERQLRDLITRAVEQSFQMFPREECPTIEWTLPVSNHEPSPTPFKQTFQNWDPLPIYQMFIEEEKVAMAPAAEQPSFFEETPEVTIPGRVIGTVRGYLVVSGKGGILQLVDQRAAHARIQFEQLGTEKQHSIVQQDLAVPIPLEYSSVDASLMREHQNDFLTLGFTIEEFGSNSFIVQSIPQTYRSTDVPHILAETLEQLQSYQEERVSEFEKKKRLANAIGKVLFSQKEVLSMEEGSALYQQLMRCRHPYQCPKGKPTIVELSADAIARLFR